MFLFDYNTCYLLCPINVYIHDIFTVSINDRVRHPPPSLIPPQKGIDLETPLRHRIICFSSF